MRTKYLILILWSIAHGLMPLVARSVEGSTVDGALEDRPKVALLPLANLTDFPESAQLVKTVLERGLRDVSLDLIPDSELRPVLRRHRIRSVGTIDRVGAEALISALNVDYLLVGSVNAYRADSLPELAFALRLLDAEQLTVVWTNSVGAAGADFATLLGIGRIRDITVLADRVVAWALDGFWNRVQQRHPPETGSKKVAVVPFDDLNPRTKAGDLVTSNILFQLSLSGVTVVEPGEVLRVCRALGRFPRGEISHDLLSDLVDSLSVDLVLTGTVDHLDMNTPGTQGQASTIALGGRLINAASGRIISAAEIEQTARGGWLDGAGGTVVEDLVRPAITKLLNQLEIEKRTQHAIP